MSALVPSTVAAAGLTEILYILIREQEEGGRADLGTRLHTSTVGFEDDNAICRDGRHKGKSVSESSPSRIVVEGEVGESISKDGEQEGEVAQKPGTSRVLARSFGRREKSCL